MMLACQHHARVSWVLPTNPPYPGLFHKLGAGVGVLSAFCLLYSLHRSSVVETTIPGRMMNVLFASLF
jgi:hypothetical protein